MPSTHSQRLERWLGAEAVARVSEAARGWYGPPIALHGVPGTVKVCGDGDFVGRISEGFLCSARDRLEALGRRLRRAARRQRHTLNAGFASLSDLIAERTAGKGQRLFFNKAGTTGVVSATNTLWYVGNQPAAGAAASAAPGGSLFTSATTGAMSFNNPSVGGDTTHFVTGNSLATVAGNTLLLYDRLFSVTKTMNSTGTEAVTGVPTRYVNTTAGTADSAEGNFLMIECRAALANTAHNWTVCTYTDQSGNTGVTLPSVTGNASCIANRLDQPTGQWFCPLATGDTGIRNLTQMQCSALVATGNIDFTIGHPIAVLPCPIANMVCVLDGINTAFNLERIFDSACLALLELIKPATNATTYVGDFLICAG